MEIKSKFKKTEMVKRCGVYVRSSPTEVKTDSVDSLELQVRECLAYVKSRENEGWRTVQVHGDPDAFGRDLQRDGLQRLMESVRSGEIDMVVVQSLHRLTRTTEDLENLVRFFVFNDVGLASVDRRTTEPYSVTMVFGDPFRDYH